MEKIKNEIESIDSNSVEAWWRHKLETRTTVPACAQLPINARTKRKGELRLAWNQLAAHDYLELSYYSFCTKNELTALDEEYFHKDFLKLFTNQYSPPIQEKDAMGFVSILIVIRSIMKNIWLYDIIFYHLYIFLVPFLNYQQDQNTSNG